MKKILAIIRNAGISIIKCNLMMKLDVGRYFPHIIYTFIVFTAVIWVSLSIDNTMAKVESSKLALKEVRLQYTDKLFTLSSVQRRASVSKLLRQMGSQVQEPEKPATVIE